MVNTEVFRFLRPFATFPLEENIKDVRKSYGVPYSGSFGKMSNTLHNYEVKLEAISLILPDRQLTEHPKIIP